MQEFHNTNESLASFIVSIYLIGYIFGPLVVAPLAELYGRSPLYHAGNVLFIIFNVACAVAPNLAGLLVFRLLAGLAGSVPLTLGAATLADIFPAEQRGAAMSAWVAGPLFGPIVGPIAAGYLSQAKGWRWVFWLVCMAAGVITIAGFIFLRETYASTLLDQKAKKLRKETGNQALRSKMNKDVDPKELFKNAIVRPTKMLFCVPIVFLLSLYMAVLYGYLYLLFTAMPELFTDVYHFSQGSIGLTYLGIGSGSAIGLIIVGSTSDRLFKHLREKNQGVGKPEFRLPPMIFGAILVPIGLFWFGWTAETKQHYILPLIGTSFVGLGIIIAFVSAHLFPGAR